MTATQIARAASELASQERYNPAWCKPGVGANSQDDSEIYLRRARMILDAALAGGSGDSAQPPQPSSGETRGTAPEGTA